MKFPPSISLNFLRLGAAVLIAFFLTSSGKAQENRIFSLNADSLKENKTAALDKTVWKYRAGDNQDWAARNFNDADWNQIEETRLKPGSAAINDWSGRMWFRLHLSVDAELANKDFALLATQKGASEVYLDGKLLIRFGEITRTEINEYNPNRLPIPFRFDGAGEHVLAVRYASSTFADVSVRTVKWLMNGGIYPGFALSVREETGDIGDTIQNYAATTSMRGGFFFAGILLALALLHFLLYLFYRIERANLFYSFYAASFAVYLL